MVSIISSQGGVSNCQPNHLCSTFYASRPSRLNPTNTPCKFLRRGSLGDGYRTMHSVTLVSPTDTIAREPQHTTVTLATASLHLLRSSKVQEALNHIAAHAAEIIANVATDTEPNAVLKTMTTVALGELTALISAALESRLKQLASNTTSCTSSTANQPPTPLMSTLPCNVHLFENHVKLEGNSHPTPDSTTTKCVDEVPNLNPNHFLKIGVRSEVDDKVRDLEKDVRKRTTSSRSENASSPTFTAFKRPLKRSRKSQSGLKSKSNSPPPLAPEHEQGFTALGLLSSLAIKKDITTIKAMTTVSPAITPPLIPKWKQSTPVVSAVKARAIAGVTKIVSNAASQTAKSIAQLSKERLNMKGLKKAMGQKEYNVMRTITINAAAFLTGTINNNVRELADHLRNSATYNDTDTKNVQDLTAQLLKSESIGKIIIKSASLIKQLLVQSGVDQREAAALSSTVHLLLSARIQRENANKALKGGATTIATTSEVTPQPHVGLRVENPKSGLGATLPKHQHQQLLHMQRQQLFLKQLQLRNQLWMRDQVPHVSCAQQPLPQPQSQSTTSLGSDLSPSWAAVGTMKNSN